MKTKFVIALFAALLCSLVGFIVLKYEALAGWGDLRLIISVLSLAGVTTCITFIILLDAFNSATSFTMWPLSLQLKEKNPHKRMEITYRYDLSTHKATELQIMLCNEVWRERISDLMEEDPYEEGNIGNISYRIGNSPEVCGRMTDAIKSALDTKYLGKRTLIDYQNFQMAFGEWWSSLSPDLKKKVESVSDYHEYYHLMNEELRKLDV